MYSIHMFLVDFLLFLELFFRLDEVLVEPFQNISVMKVRESFSVYFKYFSKLLTMLIMQKILFGFVEDFLGPF